MGGGHLYLIIVIPGGPQVEVVLQQLPDQLRTRLIRGCHMPT